MAEMVICENILTISGYRNHTLTVLGLWPGELKKQKEQ
jgi:hypothetical protein